MIGRITHWNNQRAFGFITVSTQSPVEAPSQQQFFFHISNFQKGEQPILGAIVVFQLGDGISEGKKVQAIGVRFATDKEIRQAGVASGLNALAGGAQ